MRHLMAGIVLAASLGAASLGGAANAEVTAKAPDGLALAYVATVPLSKEKTWARLIKLSTWWSGKHSYSGNAANMRVDARAGGCWCEIWSGGKIEHGRVIALMPNQLLRFNTALGPLQEMGLSGSLTFALADGATPGSTKVTVTYKVSGSSLSNLDQLASIVDGVVGEQVARLANVEGVK